MKKFGLIGSPLKHSFSYGYFKNKFIEEKILYSEYNNYELDKVSDVKSLIKKDKNICGLNVTIPYKEQIIPYLDDIESIAKEIGSVNVINKENNKLVGYNTDYAAFMYSLKLWLPNFKFSSVVLGTGGSSKAVKYALKKLNIPSIFVSRFPSNSEISYDELSKGDILKNNKLIINTTPLGMFPNINTHPSINFKSLVSLDKWFEAIHYFKKAFKIDNGNINYIKSLAFAEFKVGNMVSSVELYKKALDLDPTDFNISLDFSLMYYESGDVEKAISIIEDSIDEVPHESLLYYRLVIYLMDAGKYKESINVLESALSLNFDNHEVLFDFVPNFESQSALIRVINQYRKNNLK